MMFIIMMMPTIMMVMCSLFIPQVVCGVSVLSIYARVPLLAGLSTCGRPSMSRAPCSARYWCRSCACCWCRTTSPRWIQFLTMVAYQHRQLYFVLIYCRQRVLLLLLLPTRAYVSPAPTTTYDDKSCIRDHINRSSACML